MPSAPEIPKKSGIKPKITKTNADEPALPTGRSSIKIVVNTDERDLHTAAEDANTELKSLLADPADNTDEIGSLDEDTAPITDDLTEPLEADSAAGPEKETVPNTRKDKDADGVLDDAVTDKAIDDIMAEESDAVLAAEDLVLQAEAAAAEVRQIEKPKRFWRRSWFRWSIFLVLLLGIGAAAATPTSRYYVLNTAGVRSSMSLKVIDGGTRQPLKNVSVTAGGISGQTDAEGVVRLGGLRLGPTTLLIEKRAFTSITKPVTIGWGSNPLQDFEVTAVGTQYIFIAQDYLSGKPIGGAQAASGEGNASADDEGTIVLTLDTASLEDTAQFEVEISAEGYRTEKVSLAANNKETQSVPLVPARRHAFLSKRSGNYDLYTIDIDGKNERRIVTGTGLERDDITLIPHAKEPVAALVSTRENARNASGFLLSTLYLVDLGSGELTRVDQSEKIQITGFTPEGYLVYVKAAAGAAAADPGRHRLMSYNMTSQLPTELAAANAFNDVLMAGGRVYYAPSYDFEDSPDPGVFAVSPDGQKAQKILSTEAYVLQRGSYETLDINTGEIWFSYTIGSASEAVPGQPAAAGVSRLYTDNPGNDFSLWVDKRDGRGVLLLYDRGKKQDTQLAARAGLGLPVYWLTDRAAVFRAQDSRETADYVVSIDGGEARKITDVAGSAGLDSRYNY